MNFYKNFVNKLSLQIVDEFIKISLKLHSLSQPLKNNNKAVSP